MISTNHIVSDIFTCFILISKWNVRGLIGLRDFHTTLHSAKQAPFAYSGTPENLKRKYFRMWSHGWKVQL